jgi:hypothetical protein
MDDIVRSLFLTLALTFLMGETSNYERLAAVASQQECEQVGKIIKVEGQVGLKRRHQSDYQSATVGTQLCRGDRLKPAEGATVIIHCEGSSRRARLPDGVPSGVTNICPQTPLSNNSEVFRGEDNDDPSVPLIINFGKIFNNRPLLRWHPAEDTQIYRVQLRGGDIDWETQVSGTKIIYDGEALQPGETYALKVTAIKTDDSQSFSSVPLSLISEQEALEVTSSQAEIASREQNREAAALALAQLYIKHNLNIDAVETLRAIAEQGSQNPDIYRKIAEIYAEMELHSLADSYYLQANEL